MAKSLLEARPPVPVKILDFGKTLSAVLCTEISFVSITARKGCLDALRAKIKEQYGLDLPDASRAVAGEKVSIIWAGPDQWVVTAPDPETRDLEFELREVLGGLASVVDQSSGRTVIRISGERARDVLAKGLPLDLHPKAFQPGHAAITHIDHIGAMFWQLDASPVYEVAVFRSFTESFADWLVHSAHEFAH